MNPVYEQIRSKLTQLELERDSLLQRYTADDRLVKDKETEIAELKKRSRNGQETSVGSESISLNDVHRRILNELLQARVQLRALNEKKINSDAASGKLLYGGRGQKAEGIRLRPPAARSQYQEGEP